MLWAFTVILLFLWVVGFASGLALGLWVHGLLVLAGLALAVDLVRSRA